MKIPLNLQAKRDEWIKKNSDFEDWLKDNYFATHAYNQAFKDIMESPEMKKLEDALKEAETHFQSISNGLTTDIKRVEEYTKRRAYEAKIEVRLALATYKAWVGNE